MNVIRGWEEYEKMKEQVVQVAARVGLRNPSLE